MSDLRIVYFGTPDFAVAPLDELVSKGYNIIGVVTAPDKPAGRGKQIQVSSVKQYAEEKGLKLFQPVKLKEEAFLQELKMLNADLQIVVAFRMLPDAVWNMPSKGTFNLHASLLPQYRGAAPINWAIINGEKETGVTTFFLKHEIDTGNIIFQEKCTIHTNETAGELHDRLMLMGRTLVLRTVEAIDRNEISPVEQKTLGQQNLKHAPKLFKEDGRIDFTQSSQAVTNKIHGLSPYPTAFFEIENEKKERLNIKVFKALAENTGIEGLPGQILTDKRSEISIVCGQGAIKLVELQLQGKKRMSVPDFIRGFDIASWNVI